MPQLDETEAMLEAGRLAREGNLLLTRAVEALRMGLETIARAEYDAKTGLPVTTVDLRKIAVEHLDEYSGICGQDWRNRSARLTGKTRAGDRNVSTLAEQERGHGG